MKTPDATDLITEITRRQWLLRLGEMAVLAGVSGIVPETPTFLFAAEPERSALPPGLYLPSADDLVHALSSGHHLTAPPAGSETEYVLPGTVSGPLFFSQHEFRTVARVVEIALGKMEPNTLPQTVLWIDLWLHSAKGVRESARQLNPLHRTLAVAYFGEQSVSELETADPGAVAREGIATLHKLCLQEHHADFLDLDSAEQEKVVREISTAPADSSQRKFFDLIRNQAIRGFYTSAEGMKELDYKGNTYHPNCPSCESMEK